MSFRITRPFLLLPLLLLLLYLIFLLFFSPYNYYVSGEDAYPLNVSSSLCSREDVRSFAVEARELGVQYVGLCCGNCTALLREVAEAYGKKPPSLKYAPDIRHSIAVGDSTTLTPRQRKVMLHMVGRLRV